MYDIYGPDVAFNFLNFSLRQTGRLSKLNRCYFPLFMMLQYLTDIQHKYFLMLSPASFCCKGRLKK